MNGLRLGLMFFFGCALHAWLAGSVAPLVWGVVPHVLLLATVAVSITDGRRAGEVFGFLWGFYLDVLGVRLFGANCLLFTAIGYFAGNVRRHMDVNQPLPHATVVLVMTVAYHFAYAVLALIFSKRFLLPGWPVLLVQPLLNAAVAPFLLVLSSPGRSRRSRG